MARIAFSLICSCVALVHIFDESLFHSESKKGTALFAHIMYRLSDELSSMENRIAKLTEQLSHVIENSPNMQNRSREHFSDLADRLRECAELAEKCAELHRNTEVPSEPVSDLSDIPEMSQNSFNKNASADSKSLMRKYSEAFTKASNLACGVVQVNQIAPVIEKWFNNRYFPEIKNKNFHYNAGKIINWVDAIILKYGHSVSTGAEAEFIENIDSWIDSLRYDVSNTWQLPYDVMSILSSDDPDMFTKEAIVVERIFKENSGMNLSLPEWSDSVEKIVISKNKGIVYGQPISELLSSTSSFVVTSSFDPSKYSKE